MVLSKPTKAWHYATITTIASILGGMLGYALGFFAFELIGQPLLDLFGYQEAYDKVASWFLHYGFWAVFVAGFTPIPYKLFTLAAGVTMMPLLPFFVASIFGRTIRFFVVVWGIKGIGKRIEPLVMEYIDTIAWVTIGLIGIGLVLYYCLG